MASAAAASGMNASEVTSWLFGTDKFILNLGETKIYEGDVLPTLWWVLLSTGSCINIVLLLCRLANIGQDRYVRKMTYCSAAFVIACAVRSIWPRVDVERTCFWDTRISVTFVGRTLATVAEICFVSQFTMTIGVLAEEMEFPKTLWMSNIWYWAICVAQCCCWMGVTTQRQIWHGVEESIWAMTFTGIAISFAVLYTAIRKRSVSRKDGGCGLGVCRSAKSGYAMRFLFFGFPGCVAYVLFMVLVDVPMYINRYNADQARGAKYNWFSDGVLDSMSCRTVSKSLKDWEPEMPWMTGYFLGATLVSLWLTWGPKLDPIIEDHVDGQRQPRDQKTKSS